MRKLAPERSKPPESHFGRALPSAPQPCPTSSTSRVKFFATRSPPWTSRARCGKARARRPTPHRGRNNAGPRGLSFRPRRRHWQSLRGHGAGAHRTARSRHSAHRHSRRASRLDRPRASQQRIVDVPGFRSIGAGHPLPDAGSMAAARAILDLLAGADARTLVFFLLSGGGSALVELPLHPSVTLDDIQELYRLLVNCGAPIDEINAVRKHVSAVKGGRLAAAAPAATKLTIGVSDVPEGRESALASGPTLPDPTTTADACRVIEQYGLMPKLPASVSRNFQPPRADPGNTQARRPRVCEQPFPAAARIAAIFSSSARQAAEEKRVARRLRQLHRRLAHRRSRRPSSGTPRAAAQRQPRPPRRCDCRWRGQLAGHWRRRGRAQFGVRAELRRENRGKRIAVLSAGTDGKDGSSPRQARSPTARRSSERGRPISIRGNSSAAPTPTISFANSATLSKPAPPAIICATCAFCSRNSRQTCGYDGPAPAPEPGRFSRAISRWI